MSNIEFNPLEKLDTNNDNKLVKEELEQLGTKVGLQAIENNVIQTNISKLPTSYQDFLKWKSIEEKKWYIFLLEFWKKNLWKDSYERLINKIPLNEVSLFLYELMKLEKQKDLLKTANIILTDEEIEHLKEKILIDYTKTKLDKFLDEQLNENISSAELIKGTSFEEKLKQAWYNPYKFVKDISLVWENFILKDIKNLSKDTEYNIWTWMFLVFSKLYDKKKLVISKNKLIFNENTNEKIKNANKNIQKAIKALKLNKTTSENNEILMNPEKFSTFYLNILEWKTQNIEEELKKWQKKGHAVYDKAKIIQENKELMNKIWDKITTNELKTIEPITKIWNAIKEFKKQINGTKEKIKDYINNNSDEIMWLKEMLESIWIWKFTKWLFDDVLKLLWFDNGWDDFEKNVEKNKFKNVIQYFKNKLDIKNIKKDEDSIFYAWLIKKDKNIKDIKITWKLSYNVMKNLQKTWWNDKNYFSNMLDNFFNKNVFEDNVLDDNKKEEFYKKVFKIEKNTTKDKEIEKIWTINMDELDKYLAKYFEKEESDNTDNTDNTYPITIKWLESIKISDKDKKLLDFIGKYESWNNYNAIYWNANQNNIDFTKITLEEVIKNRKKAVNNWLASSAVWKYQFLTKTLEDMIKKYSIDPNTKFSPDFQDKLAILKAKERWWNKFLRWEMTEKTFIKNLSKEWASIPKNTSWKSFYSGDWLNQALVSYNDTQNTINDIRQA